MSKEGDEGEIEDNLWMTDSASFQNIYSIGRLTWYGSLSLVTDLETKRAGVNHDMSA